MLEKPCTNPASYSSPLPVVPVLAKLPLGLLVPTFTKDVPNDFPFKPFWRDAFITSLSVMCRGEFNVVVASFGLSQGLLDADVYSAIVMAILISSIIGPLLLSQTIRHYNQLSDDYFSKPHLVERIKNSRDGTRPLFFAIQIRTPASWGLHEKFQHAIQDLGLMVLDHRTWHTNGLESVAMSEIFVRDTLKNITVKNCFDENASTGSDNSTSSSDASHWSHNRDKLGDFCDKVFEDLTAEDCIEVSFGAGKAQTFLSQDVQEDNQEKGHTEIENRILQIQGALEACLGEVDPSECVIQTKQWEPFLQSSGKGHQRQHTYAFQDTGSSMNNKSHQRQPTYTFQDIADDQHSSEMSHQRQSTLADIEGTRKGQHLKPTKNMLVDAPSVGKRHHRQHTGTFQGISTDIFGVEEDGQSQRSLSEIPGKTFEGVSAGGSDRIPPVVNEANDTKSTVDVKNIDAIFLNYFKTLQGNEGDKESGQQESHQVISDQHSLASSSSFTSVDSNNSCEASMSSKTAENLADKNALGSPAEKIITRQVPSSAVAILADQSVVSRPSQRRTLSTSFRSSSSKTVKAVKNKHRRVATHGQNAMSMLAEGTTSVIASTPKPRHKRNATQGGQCYGILVGGDLWDSDPVNRNFESPAAESRRDSLRATTRSGSFNRRASFRSNSGSHAESITGSLQEGSQLRDVVAATPGGDEQFISHLRSTHEQPGAVVQQHLQGYIRH